MKYLLVFAGLLSVQCAHMKQDSDEDSENLAALELDKVGLYQSNLATAPAAEAALPSPYLRLGNNLITNGSFENPVLAAPWAIYATGTVPGWSGAWVDASCMLPVQLELQSKDLLSNAPDLNQYAELDSDGACTQDARIKLAQTIPTQANHIYRLSFWMRARDTEHKMGLSLDLGQGFSAGFTPLAGQWQIVTLHFEALAATTTLSFTDTGDGDTFGTLIDAVEVREVTADVASMPHTGGQKPPKPKNGQSFSGGRRHKDCGRARPGR